DGGRGGRRRASRGVQAGQGLGARRGGGNDYHVVLAAAGASILPMPLTEVRPALEGGKLAVAQNSFEALVSFRFHEVAKFVTVGGSYGTLTIFTPIIMSQAVWQSLSEE